MDTIDISNLNRQFLFRKEHVGQSKSETLKNQILSKYPNLEIYSYNSPIQSFPFTFFFRFQAIIHALDHEEARKYVN